ncbi:PIG-L deacetylase family protein [Kiritimatiella glycovorans]|uniref:Putative deacetylase n=1 Tax=Kiritimatiella glycovorans TaxID=1307763 RepID=A0A0G3EES4_9BACT|nr:PIG-L deacetylase family protein [Kiritimatiella glycovorans]AKJ63887.1 putative deacetylase [Kiritimatiella glycovorans]
MNLLAIGAHPDDIEYGCGGTLLKAADAGHRIHLLVMTCGIDEATAGVRQQEQERAADLLGAELNWGGFRDTSLVYGRELITVVESAVERIEPDLVLVNSPEDSHQDHRALAKSTSAACRYVKNLLYYHDYTSIDFRGHTFVDIGEVLGRKVDLLSAHASQTGKPNPAGLDMCASVRALAMYYGFVAKVRYAEAFDPLRVMLPL